MTKISTTQEKRVGQLRKSFLEFHRANPWVYERLVELCFELKSKGFKKYSMRTLVAVLRFEWDLKTGGQTVILASGEPRRVKLNDHHTAYYARYFVAQYPEFRDFFEFRTAEGDEDFSFMNEMEP